MPNSNWTCFHISIISWRSSVMMVCCSPIEGWSRGLSVIWTTNLTLMVNGKAMVARNYTLWIFNVKVGLFGFFTLNVNCNGQQFFSSNTSNIPFCLLLIVLILGKLFHILWSEPRSKASSFCKVFQEVFENLFRAISILLCTVRLVKGTFNYYKMLVCAVQYTEPHQFVGNNMRLSLFSNE